MVVGGISITGMPTPVTLMKCTVILNSTSGGL